MNQKQIQKLEQKVQKERERYLNLPDHTILRDNVLVKTVIFQDQDGIYTPQSYEDKPSYGIVVSVGSGKVLDDGTHIIPEVKEGDFILFGKYGSTKERVNGEDFHYIREEDIISKIEI